MTTATTQKVIRIGNSRGIRLSRGLMRKYGFRTKVTLEERKDGLVIRSADEDQKWSYEDTFKAMRKAHEDWSEWDATLNDGE